MSNRRSRVRQGLSQALQGLRKRVQRPRVHFTGDMTVDEAWNAHPRAPKIFARYQLPGCDECAVRFEERLDEVTEAYGIDLDRFLHDLNKL